MTHRRVRFVPAIDYLATRIAPSGVAVDVTVAVAAAATPTIDPNDSTDGSSVTNPGYGDVGSTGQDASSGDPSAGDGTGSNGLGLTYDGSYFSTRSGDLGNDPMAPQLPDEGEYSCASPVGNVPAFE
jgi:hypothetical protein